MEAETNVLDATLEMVYDLYQYVINNPDLTKKQILKKLKKIPGLRWSLVGQQIGKNLGKQNTGDIEKNTDGLCIITELLANMIDACLDLEWVREGSLEDLKKLNQLEASIRWFGVPKEGLGFLSRTQRRELADRIGHIIVRKNGYRYDDNNKLVSYEAKGTYDVRDFGIGQLPSDFVDTLLSLLNSNKQDKYYTTGSYGFGGASSFDKEFCDLSLIVSKKFDSNRVGFTFVVNRQPNKNTKDGQYYYCTINGEILEVEDDTFRHGTLKRHYNCDVPELTKSQSARGNPYNAFGYMMPSPALPFMLENYIRYDDVEPVGKDRHPENSQVLYGTLNRLKAKNYQKKNIIYSNSVMASIEGVVGEVGIHYFVFPMGKDKASESYVDPLKPIIFSDGGQCRHLMGRSALAHKGINYLKDHMAIFITTDSLVHAERKKLFGSNRQEMRSKNSTKIGQMIRTALTDDDQIIELNTQFQDAKFQDSLKNSVFGNYDKSLIKFLNGIEEGIKVDRVVKDDIEPIEIPKLPDMEVQEPPTEFRFVMKKLQIPPGTRKNITLITDANPDYVDHIDSDKNRITFDTSDLVVGNLYEAIPTSFNCSLPTESVHATGIFNVDTNQMTVTKNSTCRKLNVDSCPPFAITLKQRLVDAGILSSSGVNYKFTTDHVFKSPSTASMVILGRPSNGNNDWKHNNIPLKKYKN